MKKAILGLFVLITALTGCNSPLVPATDMDGSIILSFSDNRAKTIVPSVSLDIASFDISFTRTGETTITLNDVPGSTTQTNPVYLKPGSWTVTANAKNAAGNIIGVGTASFTVNAGHTTTVSLTILSLTGNGTFELTADTSELTMTSPSVVGTLTPGNGSAPVSMTFTMGTGSAAYSGSLAAGTYLMQMELWDGSLKLASYVDTVLVVSGFPTSAALAFKPKNGNVIVQLVDQITRAIPITLSGAASTLTQGSTMTVTATPAVAVDSYQWYLDGEPIAGATADTVTVGAGLDVGDYTLTVTVKKGAVYSSESVEFEVTEAGTFKAVSAGFEHTVVLKLDGTLWGFGLNNYGQLGCETTPDVFTPSQIMSDVSCASAGYLHTMIVRTDGTLWSCGWNDNGQLGDGTTVSRSSPVQVMSDVAYVSSGWKHSMIVKTDGSLWACGCNENGQLGDGTTIDRYLPVQIMADVASVSSGAAHTMILKKDGTLWACGMGNYGQLGDGTNLSQWLPVQMMSNVLSVSSNGSFHTLIIDNTGALWACGYNFFGQLGDGTKENRSLPVHIMNDAAFASTGPNHSTIIKKDGTVWTFGMNNVGQLGNGTTENQLFPSQIADNALMTSGGEQHTMIIINDNTLWGCGSNGSGQLGMGYPFSALVPCQINF